MRVHLGELELMRHDDLSMLVENEKPIAGRPCIDGPYEP